MKFNEKPVHWPTLNTVLMVEETLKNMDESVITIAELKRKLPRQVNHNTLMIILEYLEKSGKILSGIRGISWVYTDSKILREWVKKGTEI
ncbi:hypothetical protein HYW74_02195 [Candidatus Pacearchaeota archaeon]|nr:hypothetical protein [Candidatus Pacearchaeota archaeon]